MTLSRRCRSSLKALGRAGRSVALLMVVSATFLSPVAAVAQDDSTDLVSAPGAGDSDAAGQAAADAATQVRAQKQQVDTRIALLEEARQKQDLGRLEIELKLNRQEAQSRRDEALKDLKTTGGLNVVTTAISALEDPVSFGKMGVNLQKFAEAEPGSKEEADARNELLAEEGGQALNAALKALSKEAAEMAGPIVAGADVLLKAAVWQAAEQNLQSAVIATQGTLDFETKLSALRAQSKDLDQQAQAYDQIQRSGQVLPFYDLQNATPRAFIPIPFQPGEPSIDAALSTCVLSQLQCINPVPDAPQAQPANLAVPASHGMFEGNWTGTFSGTVNSRGCNPMQDSGDVTAKVIQSTDASAISGQMLINGRLGTGSCSGYTVAASSYHCDVKIPVVTPTGRNVTFNMSCENWRQDVLITLNQDLTATARMVSRDADGSWDISMTLKRS